jgi:hypothetical protein
LRCDGKGPFHSPPSSLNSDYVKPALGGFWMPPERNRAII